MTEPNIWDKIMAYVAENRFNAAKEAEMQQKEEIETLAEDIVDDLVDDQKLDCIYDDEPLGFEEDPMGSTTRMRAQDPLEEVDLGLTLLEGQLMLAPKFLRSSKIELWSF